MRTRNRMPVAMSFAAAVSLATVGCSDERVDTHEPIVRDSAGIAIIENRSTTGEPREWHLPALEVEIGRADGEGAEVFGAVQQVVRLPEGRIAVADRMSLEVRIFGPAGTHLLSFGRRGEGPGEFSRLSWIGALPGDSIAAFDQLTRRVSIFSSDGEFSRSFVVPQIEGGRVPNVIGGLSDGTLVLTTATASPSQDTRPQSTVLVYAIDTEGRLVDELGEFLDRELGRNGLVKGFGGSAVVAAGGSLIWYGHNDHLSLHGLDPSGAVQRIVRSERTPRLVTEREVDEARATVEASFAREGASGPAVQRILETEYASVHPAHGRVLVGQNGFLWVARYEIPTLGAETSELSSETWDIFDSEGRWRTQLSMPAGFRASEVGEDFVLGIHSDELGVQRVRMYRLSGPR